MKWWIIGIVMLVLLIDCIIGYYREWRANSSSVRFGTEYWESVGEQRRKHGGAP
jgi:hypothetical protein